MKRRDAISFRLLTFLLLPFLVLACDDGGTDPEDDGNDGPGANPAGGEVWLSAFNGGEGEAMEAVILTSGGDYLVVGGTDGVQGGDAWVVAVEPDGTVAWQKAYGGTGFETAYDVKETSDGGFVVAGLTESYSNGGQDIWVFKIDATGAVQWEKSYGGAGQEQAWSVDVTDDGGYVIAGGTTSYGAGGSDLLVIRLDGSGEIVWQKALGGTGDDAPGGEYSEHVARAFVDGGGNIVAATVTLSFGSGGSDIWVVKLDPSGSVLWEYAYGDEDEDGMWMAQEHVGGGYFVPGYFTPIDDYDTDLWGLSLNPDGTIAWQKTYGIAGVYDEALSVGMTADGGALIGGSYYEDGDSDWSWTLTRVGPDGALTWNRKYERGFDWPNSIVELPDGRFVVAGVTMVSLDLQEDLWLMKLESDGTAGGTCSEVVDQAISVENTAVSPVASSATVTDATITPQITSATVVDTDEGHAFDCSDG